MGNSVLSRTPSYDISTDTALTNGSSTTVVTQNAAKTYTDDELTATTKTFIFMAGNIESGTAGSTRYMGFLGGWGRNNEWQVKTPTSLTGTISDMYIEAPSAPGTGESNTFTVRKNTADTNLAVALSDLNTAGNDTSDTVSVTAGDILTISATASAGTALTGTSVSVSFKYTPN